MIKRRNVIANEVKQSHSIAVC